LNLEKEIGSFNVLELSREGGELLQHGHVLDPSFGTSESNRYQQETSNFV
jgi:hypothetical protein